MVQLLYSSDPAKQLSMACNISIRRLTQFLRTYVNILLSWRSIITFGFCSLGALLYYGISWTSLQLLWSKVIVEMLELGGYVPFRVDNNIWLGNGAIQIGSLCTYIPLILMGLPLIWRGDRLICDIFRIFFFVMIVCLANAVRLYLTLTLLAKGIAWKYAHDIINHLTYGPILALILFLWLKAMKSHLLKSSDMSHNEK